MLAESGSARLLEPNIHRCQLVPGHEYTDSNRRMENAAPKIKLHHWRSGDDYALRVNLVLPATALPGIRYRAELIDGSGQIRTLTPTVQDAGSVSIEVPVSCLSPGQYAVTLATMISDNSAQRIPGNYEFIIE